MPVELPCRGCGASIDCQSDEATDYVYTLTADQPFPFFFFCPTGFSCRPGPGQNQPLSINCCGHILTANIDGNTTDAQLAAIMQGLLNQCQQFAGECGNAPSRQNHPDSFFFSAPQSATARCESGSVFGYTTPSGAFASPALFPSDEATWLAQANAQALAYAQQKANSLRSCMGPGPSLPGGPAWSCLGGTLDPLLNTFHITGPQSGGVWTFSVVGGVLPPGVTLDIVNGNTAELNGVVTTAGSYTYTIKATRTTLPLVTVSVTQTFHVFGITNSTLPNGVVGVPYSEQLLVAGGTLPVTFALHPGDTLPTGLTLHTDGLIDGTPTAPGIDGFGVDILDAEGGNCTQTVTVQITGGGALDWSTLVWDPFTAACTPAFPFSGPNGTFLGATFSVDADGGNNDCNEANGPSSGFCNGNLLYTGPAVAGNLHLVCNPTGSTSAILVNIRQDGNIIATIIKHEGAGGTFDVPFTVIDTLGVPSLLNVFVSWSGGAAFGTAGAVTANGVIT